MEGWDVLAPPGEEEGGRRLLEFDFNPHRLYVLWCLGVSVSSLSFAGGLFVVTSYWMFPRLRGHFAFEQVANMAACDMGACVAYFLGYPGDRTGLCVTQALLQQFFELASVLWATVIATTLFVAIRRREALAVEKWRASCYLWAYGAPAVFALLPLSTRSYGTAGAWCWIRTKPRLESNAWRFSIFYVPIWCAMIYNARVYGECAFVIHRLSTVADDAASLKLKRTVARLIRYPAILVACWTIPTINRIQQVAQPDPIFLLYVLSVVSRSSVGLLNALNFGFTDQVKNEWRSRFRDSDFCRLRADDRPDLQPHFGPGGASNSVPPSHPLRDQSPRHDHHHHHPSVELSASSGQGGTTLGDQDDDHPEFEQISL